MVYKTPSVYEEAISAFSPSVVEVESAIPTLIGYTETAEENGSASYHVLEINS